MKYYSGFKGLFWGLAFSVLAPVAQSAGAEALFEINFQSIYPPQHVLNHNFYIPAIKELEEKSQGRLRIHYFASGAMLKGEDVLPSVLNGNLDMGGTRVVYTDTLFPYSMALDIPYIAEDCVQASKLYWQAYSQLPEVKAEMDKAGKFLTVWGSDRCGLFSTKGPILSPDDLRGKRVLVWSGGLVDQVKAWGATPVLTAVNDSYLSLQRGVGDVIMAPLPAGVSFKLVEVAKDVTVMPTSTFVMINVINREVWNDMPGDIQDMLMETFGGEAASIKSGKLLYEGTQKDIETMKQSGCTVHYLTTEQYQKFRDKDNDVIMNFWRHDLKRLGLSDPEAWIRKVFDMAASVPKTS